MNEELFRLACMFRSNKHKASREVVAKEYKDEVIRLIATGKWNAKF